MDRSKLFGKHIHAEIYQPEEDLILEAISDYETMYLTGWKAPTTGGGRAILPAGERIKVQTYSKGAIAANCTPINYDKLHSLIVPESDRINSKYSGYGLVIPLDDLDNYFIEVDT